MPLLDLYGREAAAYVQSLGLKAVAVVLLRLINSRSPERASPGDTVKNVLHTPTADYDAVSFDIGLKKVHILNNPDLIDEATRKADVFQKPHGLQKYLSFFGETGIFTSQYDDWSQHKMVLARFLARGTLPQYQDDINQTVGELVDKWEKNGTKDIYEDFKDFAIVNFFRAVLKFDVAPYKDQLKEYVDYLNNEVPLQALNPLTYVFGHAQYPKHGRAAIDFVQKVLDKVLEPHLDAYTPEHITSEILNANGFYDAKNDVEKQAAKQKTYQQMTELFIAGYDSTASSLTWLYHRLAQNPDVQDRVCKELSEVAPGGDVTLEASRNLKYLQRVIFETVRINPTLHLAVPRKAMEDFTFKSGYQIKKGQYFIVPIFAVNTDPTRFEAPEEFNPDRTLGMKANGRTKEGELAFYAGPHACIGKSLFLFETSILVAKTLQKFKLTPTGPLPSRSFKTTITPTNGQGMNFEKRTSFDFSHVTMAEEKPSAAPGQPANDVSKCPFHRVLGIKK